MTLEIKGKEANKIAKGILKDKMKFSKVQKKYGIYRRMKEDTELRTLKDMIFHNQMEADNEMKRTLRAEAIKWVKDYQERGLNGHAYEFIKFFNLEEEDLK